MSSAAIGGTGGVSPEEEAQQQSGDETVAVFAAPDEVTAEIVRGALEAAGIYAVIGEQVTHAYSGFLQVGEGYWGEVRVNPEDEEAARTVIAAYESGQGTVPDDEIAAQAQAAPADPEV